MLESAVLCEDPLTEGGESASDERIEPMVRALEGRAAFYDLLASLYFKPLTEDQIDRIASMDMSAYASLNERFASGVNDISRYVARRTTATRQDLAVDFTAAFAGTSSWEGRYAVPYESVFTSDEGLLFQDSYHEVHALFRENRVRRSEGYDFPDDHLSFMCEFQAILSRRAIDFLGEGDRAGALEHIAFSRSFMEDHILPWFPEFRDLALRLLATRFYRGVLSVTEGFFELDRELTDDMMAELR